MFIYPAEPDRKSEIMLFMDHTGTNEAIVEGGVRNRTSVLQIMRLVCCRYTTPHLFTFRALCIQASGLEPESP